MLGEFFDNLWVSMAGAVEYNRKNAAPINVDGFPNLILDPRTGSQSERQYFAWDVLRYQIRHSLTEDGKLGPSTRGHMEKSPEGTGRGFWHNGVLIDAPIVVETDHWTSKTSSRGNYGIQWVVVHWNGKNVEHCIRTLESANASTHFIVGKHEGAGGLPAIVHQLADTFDKAWHAGEYNARSIGVDIAQRIQADSLHEYLEAGYDVQVIDNFERRPDGSKWGQDQVLSLDPKIARQTNELLHALCDAYGIPKKIPRDHSLMSDDFWRANKGVVFHSHLVATKWDVAPWFDQLVDGFELVEIS
tara:strand:+ start:2099 stop:3004 length:906 start_codon:yes stop_codon:yes gene_type:complete